MVLLQLQLLAGSALLLARVPEALATVAANGEHWIHRSRHKLRMAYLGCTQRLNFIIRCSLPILELTPKYFTRPPTKSDKTEDPG